MQIGQAVFEALVKNEAGLLAVVADWIEDNLTAHPESALYMRRLRTPGARVRTVIDVVCKFGSRADRKLFSRCDRVIMKMRHRPESPIPDVGDLFSMSSRRKINRATSRPAEGSCSRKKPLLAKMRKRTVLNNKVWYIRALVGLLAKHYPLPARLEGTDGSDSNEAPAGRDRPRG